MSVMSYELPSGKKQYRVKFEYEKQLIQKKGFKSKIEALKREAEERRRLENPEPEKTPLISVEACANKYLEFCSAGRMQLNTYRAKAKYYADFIAWLGSGDIPAEEISKIQILSYLDEVQKTQGSISANRHLKDLKALWNWCYLNDLVQEHPLKAIQPYPEEPKVKYIPPPEDIDAVLLAADPEETDMLTVLYHTGGRIGEIRRLTWEDVNFEKRSIALWTRKRRGGQLEPDKLAMGESLLELLRRRWNHRDKQSVFVFPRADGTAHTKDGKLRHLMEDLCVRAAVKPFGFHAIRHHVASILADSGKATLGQIQKFLRHKRPTTTERYLHEVTRDQQEVAEILESKKDDLRMRRTDQRGNQG